jgi:hypothetical protein
MKWVIVAMPNYPPVRYDSSSPFGFCNVILPFKFLELTVRFIGILSGETPHLQGYIRAVPI